MRLFLAINFPAPVQREIATATAPLRQCAPELGWTAEDRLHLTLKFLGEQAESRVDALAETLAKTAVHHRELLMTVGGIGAFPNFRRPRVVWIGVSPEPKLELLHHDVESTCETLGIPVDGKPFRPHLTLARVKQRAADPRALPALARAASDVDYVEEVVITGIDLMASELTTAGSRYRVLTSVPLRD